MHSHTGVYELTRVIATWWRSLVSHLNLVSHSGLVGTMVEIQGWASDDSMLQNFERSHWDVRRQGKVWQRCQTGSHPRN